MSHFAASLHVALKMAINDRVRREKVSNIGIVRKEHDVSILPFYHDLPCKSYATSLSKPISSGGYTLPHADSHWTVIKSNSSTSEIYIG